jgi:hypothetical protein
LDLIVLATKNEGKVAELKTLLQGVAARIESLRDHPSIVLPPERGTAYEENAAQKARAVFDALGVPALGDDSGLEVAADLGERWKIAHTVPRSLEAPSGAPSAESGQWPRRRHLTRGLAREHRRLELVLRQTGCDRLLRIEAGEVLADDFLGLISLQMFRTRIPGDDIAFRVEHEDGIVSRTLDQQAKLLGFSIRPLLVLEEVDKSAHLEFKNKRRKGLHQKVHCTEGIPYFQLRAVDVANIGGRMRFVARAKGHSDLAIELALAGVHNVRNALAAIAVGRETGVADAAIATALADFKGVGRRFQRYGDVRLDGGGAYTLIDDYGHHPVEMEATLAAVRASFPGRRLVLAFQPHRYTRTRDLFEDFVRVLSTADAVVLAEVYPAGETPIVAADSRALTRALRVAGKVEPVFVEDIANMAEALRAIARDGDVVLTMGAGSIGGTPLQLVTA